MKHNLLKYHTQLTVAIIGSLITGLTTLALAGGPPPQSPQTRPSPMPEASPRPQMAPQATPPQPMTPRQQPQAAPLRFPNPSARVTLTNGKVNVRLINTTNAVITYQLIGGTQERTLGERSEVTLESLSTPLTLTYQRQDGGLLLVRPQSFGTPGVLEVKFGTTTDVGMDTKSLNIQENGSVFLN